MWSTIYPELKGWQGAIGSLLGFAALIVGALFNFRLNRKRDERLRSEEMVAIASALYTEVVLMRQSVARAANAVAAAYFRHGFRGGEPFDKHFVDQFALPEIKLFPSLSNKVGLLPSSLAIEIVRFYSRLEEVRTWLPRLADDDTRPYSYNVLYVLDPAIDAVVQVAPALALIEKLAGIAHRAGMPDLKDALSAREHEQDQLEALRDS